MRKSITLIPFLAMSLGIASAQANFVLPIVRGTTVPMSCSVEGQLFVDTDGTIGQNVYECNGSTFDLYNGTTGTGLASCEAGSDTALCLNTLSVAQAIAAAQALAAQALVDHQGPLSAVSMTGSYVDLFTTTVPANMLGDGGCLEIYWHVNPTSTGAVSYQVQWGGSAEWHTDFAGADANPRSVSYICNDPGSTSSQSLSVFPVAYGGANWNGGIFSIWSTASVDTTSSVTLKLRASASSGTVTPRMWIVKRSAR